MTCARSTLRAAGGNLPPGTRIGPYLLDAPVRRDELSITYAAHSPAQGAAELRELLPTGLVHRPAGNSAACADGRDTAYAALADAFTAQARALTELNQPVFPQLRDTFHLNGTVYVVTQPAAGVPLAEQLAAGTRIEEATLLGWLWPLAQALAVAHARGICHLAIEPGVVLLGQKGPQLVGFRPPRTVAAAPDITPTAYAPLESHVPIHAQCAQTDIAALGAVLRHCVTGTPPLPAPARLQGLAPLDPAQYPDYSPRLLAAIDAALATLPSARPQQLSTWLEAFPPPPAGVQKSLRPTRAWLAGAAAVTTLVAAASLATNQSRATHPVTAASPADMRSDLPATAKPLPAAALPPVAAPAPVAASAVAPVAEPPIAAPVAQPPAARPLLPKMPDDSVAADTSDSPAADPAPSPPAWQPLNGQPLLARADAELRSVYADYTALSATLQRRYDRGAGIDDYRALRDLHTDIKQLVKLRNRVARARSPDRSAQRYDAFRSSLVRIDAAIAAQRRRLDG